MEIVSRPSSSRLTDLYKTKEFANEWANDVRFHVGQNILHLRKYRGMSQAKLAAAAGTSQSAIARIENGYENVTLDTVERIVVVLEGRFKIALVPQEFPIEMCRPWWEATPTPIHGDWVCVGATLSRESDADRLMAGWERRRNILTAETKQLLPQIASTSAGGA